MMQFRIPVFLAICSVALTKELSVGLRAIGLGVSNRTKSTQWYSQTFGFNKLLTVALGNISLTPFDEDILAFPQYNPRGISLVLMGWTDKPQRSVKDLPIKLQFAVPNPHKIHAALGSSGGQAFHSKSSYNPDALYGKDPDGYLLEIIPGNETGGAVLTEVSIGVSDLDKKIDWWTKTTGISAGPVKKFKEYDGVEFKGAWGGKLSFTQLHEEPVRPTLNLPYKIVLGIDDGKQYVDRVRSNGGKVIFDAGIVAFAEDPNDRSLIETNSGVINGPP